MSDQADQVPAAAGRGRIVALGIVVAGLVFGGGAAALLVNDDDDGCKPAAGAVAEVNGVAITQPQFARRVELLEALYGLKAGEGDKAADFQRDLTKSMATALIVDQEAKRRNVVVTDQDVQGAIDRYVAQYFAEGGRPKFNEAMAAKGVTEAEVVAEFRQIQTTFTLLGAATSGVTVSDEEVASAYEENKDALQKTADGQPITEEQAKTALKAQLLAQRQLAEQRKFTAQIIKDADVCYDKAYRPANPDAPPAETVPNVPK